MDVQKCILESKLDIMKNIINVVILFVVLIQFPVDVDAAGEDPVLLDTIIAVVNHEVITKLELDDEVASVSQKLRQERVPLPSILVLRKQVLERMIIQKILVQNAIESGFQAGDEIVKGMITRIMQQEQATLDELKASLKDSGLSFERFRE